MTQDEIIEMAKEVGMDYLQYISPEAFEKVTAFCKLVAQHEREACAKLLETTDLGGLKDNPAMQSWVAEMLLAYVTAIRARGQTC